MSADSDASNWHGMASTESDNHSKLNSVCESCHSGFPYNRTSIRRRRRSAVERHLPIILSTLAFVLSTTTFVYVFLNTGCTPCKIPVPDLPKDTLVDSSSDRLQEKPTSEVEQNVIEKFFKTNATDFPESLHLGKRAAAKEQKCGKNGTEKCVKKRKKGSRRHSRIKEHRVISAHFVPKPITQGFSDKEDCLLFDRKTKICKNDTAIQIGQNEEIMSNFWMMAKESPQGKKKLPVELTEGKYVRILKSGQYLIYGQALFLDSRYRTSFQVMIDGTSIMRCTESSNEQQYDVSYQSCGVSGVFSLRTNQKVSIKFPYPKTQINLKNDTTYFGLVHLSK